MSARSAVLHSLLGLSYHLGGSRLRDALRGGQVRILMYHGITSGEGWDGVTNAHGYNISAEVFERHLAYLARHCHIVSLSDALAGRRLSHRATNVVLTFDDGYENNYANAWPLLQRHQFPAIFALPTAFVRGREALWNDIFEYAVNRCSKRRVRVVWNGHGYDFSLEERPGRLALLDWLMFQGMRVDRVGRAVLMAAVREALGVSAATDELFQIADYRPLTPEQIRVMAASGLAEFASHSVHHDALTKLRPEDQRAELEDSKRQVEELTGGPCAVFCVPGGVYNDAVLEGAFAAGYDRVLTSNQGVADLGRRVLNRNCLYHERDLVTFADVTHGPVLEAVATVRGVLATVRSVVRPRRNECPAR